jgi:hypothetical protein
LPREGHLEAVFRVFTYLGLHHNAIVVFDSNDPSVGMGNFINTEWKSMYGDVKEMITSDASVSRVMEVWFSKRQPTVESRVFWRSLLQLKMALKHDVASVTS